MGDTDEEGGEDKEGGEVDCYYGFKEEIFEEIRSIDDDKDEDGWEVDCEDCIVDSSLQEYFDMHSNLYFICKNILLLKSFLGN